MKATRLLGAGAAAAGAGLLVYGAWAAATWARYGHPRLERHPPDALLDRFIPDPEVDEYHQLEVDAPAPITFAVAKAMDLQASPVVRGIFWLRAVPALLRGQPVRPQGPRGLLEETLALGFGVLAEIPNREILVGAYTQPWHQQVTFHPLPPEEFAGFAEPGYVKIVWTVAAEPLGPNRSRFVTRTRVVTTDPAARWRFRRYWGPMSAGIILIRYVSLPWSNGKPSGGRDTGGATSCRLTPAGQGSTAGTSPARPRGLRRPTQEQEKNDERRRPPRQHSQAHHPGAGDGGAGPLPHRRDLDRDHRGGWHGPGHAGDDRGRLGQA